MKQHKLFIFISLLFALFIYLFYRTENTLSNKIVIYLFSENWYTELKEYINFQIQIPENIIYSLPGGLWVFAATLASGKLAIQYRQHYLRLSYTPLGFAVGLEVFQLFNITDGTFDHIDLIYFLLFSFIGHLLLYYSSWQKINWNYKNYNSWFCISTYLIVFLAHVSI